MAGEARTRGACVSSVLCMRVLVCKAQGSECGRGSGETEAWANAGARHASSALCATFFLRRRRTRCKHTQSKPRMCHAVSRSQDSQRPPAHTAAASWRRADVGDAPVMPSNPRKHRSRAILHHHTRRIAEQACEYVLETWELPRAPDSQPKCGGHGGDDHACTPAPDFATAHATGFVAVEMRGPMESGAMADANTEGDSAMGGAITRARCKYTRGDVRGKWLELRDRLRVGAPLPLETPSLTIPETALATMEPGPPKYADFAKSVPPQNPFTPASAHGSTSQYNITQYNNGTATASIHSTYHYHASAPAATPATAAPPAASAPAASAPAAAPPNSEAQQLADVKDMFEQGLIPSREIYEAKVRQILSLP